MADERVERKLAAILAADGRRLYRHGAGREGACRAIEALISMPLGSKIGRHNFRMWEIDKNETLDCRRCAESPPCQDLLG